MACNEKIIASDGLSSPLKRRPNIGRVVGCGVIEGKNLKPSGEALNFSPFVLGAF